MDGCLHCPTCKKSPTPKFEDANRVVLECEQHGHMAIGYSLQEAVLNWNLYIVLTTKKAVLS